MAEYCSNCSSFDGQFDINLFKIALRLELGRSENFFCEGCSNRGLYKDDVGKLYLAKQEGEEIKMHLVTIEELMP